MRHKWRITYVCQGWNELITGTAPHSISYLLCILKLQLISQVSLLSPTLTSRPTLEQSISSGLCPSPMSFNGSLKALADTTSVETLGQIKEDLATMYVIFRIYRTTKADMSPNL